MALFVHIILTKCEKLLYVIVLCFEKWFLKKKKSCEKRTVITSTCILQFKDLIFIIYYRQRNKWPDMI